MLSNRGPDKSQEIYENGVFFHGAVLWQQGNETCVQPVVSEENILLFNGDLYMASINQYIESDTEFLFNKMNKAESEEEILEIFRTAIGPFSIIFMFKRKIFFARDSLGRNSLLLGRHGQHQSLFITSVIDPGDEDIQAIELPPLGVYSLNIDIDSKQVELYPYQDLNAHQHNWTQLEKVKEITEVEIKHTIEPEWLRKTKCTKNFSFDELASDLNDENIFQKLLENSDINETCEMFLDLLSSSVKDRVERSPKMCKNCIQATDISCNHCRIGILFSGGVDCSMIAILADKFIDINIPIDLMNVAFEKVSYAKKSEAINWNVPDRLTGVETAEELRRLCPKRIWNFVEINVTRDELGNHLKKLSSLVYPLCNVLDESLGAALHFASRGMGSVDKNSYSSPCRVLLIGSGADELFGGYTRHRNAFKRSTPDHDLLLEELNLDWVRLPSRNLARDDRVIADSGITVRAPFIEENFVNFVQTLKPLQRCFPALPEGVGDKLLLRLAAFKLGLNNCSKFRKRALQFGSRIADKRQSAKDTSVLLKSGRKATSS